MVYKTELDLIAEAYEEMKKPKQITEMAWGIGPGSAPINSSQIMDKVYAIELQGGGHASVTMVSMPGCPANKNKNKEPWPLFPIYKVSFLVVDIGGASRAERITRKEDKVGVPDEERFQHGKAAWQGEKLSQNQERYTTKDGVEGDYLVFYFNKNSPIKRPNTVYVTGAGGNFREMTPEEVNVNKLIRPEGENQAKASEGVIKVKPKTVVGITTQNEEGQKQDYTNTDASEEQMKALEVAKQVRNLG